MDKVFEALDKLEVELSDSEINQLKAYTVPGEAQVSPTAIAAVAAALTLLAETPAGAATLLKTDLRSIIAPSFGMEFIQRLNNDEALMLNDVQNIVQRHLRESGKVPAAIPSNPDSNPVTQPDLTLANPAPVTVGHDYNRRGPISASTLTPAPVEQRTIEQHDEDLQAGAALYQGETVGQPGVASNSATGDEPTEENTEENKEFVAP